MPNGIENFFRDWSPYFIPLALIWTAGWMSFLLWRRGERRGPHFPHVLDIDVLFREEFVSGRSFKSIKTRRGYAQSTLIVVITVDEVWVTLVFPFTALVAFYDLEHRIPRETIINVARSGKWVDLYFKASDGSDRRLQLRMRRTDEFLAALAMPTGR